MLNTDPLFELKRIHEKVEKYEQTTYDLLKFEGGAVYLTRDGDNLDCLIGEFFRDHFKKMGERGFLRNKALELYEEMYGRNNLRDETKD